MKHECAVHCDNLVSLQKSVLTNFVATLSSEKTAALERAAAGEVDEEDEGREAGEDEDES